MTVTFQEMRRFVELTRRFKTFLMENKERYGNVWGEVTSAKVQKISGVDKSGRRVTVCSLCYEEGHKRVDCPENDNHVRRCFKCGEVGHFKVDCKNAKSNGNAFLIGKKKIRDVEKITKPRCFRCNSLDHLKASCPLYKTEKDKASAKALSIGKASTPIAEKVVGPSKSKV